MYRNSGLEDQISNIFCDGKQMCIYGDLAYACTDFILTPYKSALISTQQQNFNTAMSVARQSVEWGFQKLNTIFAFLDFYKNQKSLLQPVPKYYFVAVLLCNAHTCLYGSQTSSKLQCNPPSLEIYHIV